MTGLNWTRRIDCQAELFVCGRLFRPGIRATSYALQAPRSTLRDGFFSVGKLAGWLRNCVLRRKDMMSAFRDQALNDSIPLCLALGLPRARQG